MNGAATRRAAPCRLGRRPAPPRLARRHRQEQRTGGVQLAHLTPHAVLVTQLYARGEGPHPPPAARRRRPLHQLPPACHSHGNGGLPIWCALEQRLLRCRHALPWEARERSGVCHVGPAARVSELRQHLAQGR